MDDRSRLEKLFDAIIARRVLVVVTWLALLPGAAWLALQIPSDGAIDRLVVEADPDVVRTRAFQQVFPEGRQVVLLFETPDPFSTVAIRELAAVEDAVTRVPGVVSFSALSLFRRQSPDLSAPKLPEKFRAFATGAALFKKQGLVGEHHVSMAVTFEAPTSHGRDEKLVELDRALETVAHPTLGPVRRVGQPYVEQWLETETRSATLRYFPLFGAFVVVLVIALYRSWRALLAILVTLGVTVGLSMGLGHLLGFSLTIVSELVPLVVLVTATGTLVYLHSRYIQQPEGVTLERHHVFALANKALPVTASIIAALLGFAALAVSQIRPIREMGVWTAAGLALSWLTSFTLFPALQRLLKAPTRQGETPAGKLYVRLADALPRFTYQSRWALLLGSLVVALAGAAALFGLPGGALSPMRLEVDAVEYIDPSLPLRKDMMAYEKAIAGLAAVRVWVKTEDGAAVEPETLQALERFTTAVGADPSVSSAIGPTTILRLRRYLAGQGDALPEDATEFAEATADFEQLLLTEKELRGFIDLKTMGQAQVMVITRRGDAASFDVLKGRLDALWKAEQARSPSLAKATAEVVGESILQAKISQHLVPTLTESFGLTAALIFLTFLVVFRSGAARVMAMVPSVFAILATFLVMRLTGIPLNVATILIATTVLGTTENDQVHFFHHYQEAKRDGQSAERSLLHTLHVSGHAIIYATLINASGFLALAFSNLPPMRQFGIVTAIAFAFSMLADFTALPASLWIFLREKPDQEK